MRQTHGSHARQGLTPTPLPGMVVAVALFGFGLVTGCPGKGHQAPAPSASKARVGRAVGPRAPRLGTPDLTAKPRHPGAPPAKPARGTPGLNRPLALAWAALHPARVRAGTPLRVPLTPAG